MAPRKSKKEQPRARFPNLRVRSQKEEERLHADDDPQAKREPARDEDADHAAAPAPSAVPVLRADQQYHLGSWAIELDTNNDNNTETLLITRRVDDTGSGQTAVAQQRKTVRDVHRQQLKAADTRQGANSTNAGQSAAKGGKEDKVISKKRPREEKPQSSAKAKGKSRQGDDQRPHKRLRTLDHEDDQEGGDQEEDDQDENDTNENDRNQTDQIQNDNNDDSEPLTPSPPDEPNDNHDDEEESVDEVPARKKARKD